MASKNNSTPVHIAIPNSVAMLCDPLINLDMIRVGYITGVYNQTLSHENLEPSRFSARFREIRLGKFIKYGKLPDPQHHVPPPALSETVQLKEIYESEGNFTITDILVLFPYDEEVAYYGIKQTINKVAYHRFRKWNFSPTLMAKILDRVPSYPLYESIKKERQKWFKRGGDMAAFKRLRSTWLVNKPNEILPWGIYKMWYGNGALIIPEFKGNFKGRELGTGIKP